MDPLLSLVDYVFTTNLMQNDSNSIETMFNNGKSFPFFISTICDGEEIPEIIKDPKTESQRKKNNELALHFFFQKNPKLKQINPSFKSKNDKRNLILQILSKHIFNTDNQSIIDTSNIILKKIGKSVNNIDEIQNISFLISIMNVLTNGSVKFPNEEEEEDFDINSELEYILSESDLSIFIDSSSFDEKNLDLYLVQIQVIFNVYIKKIQNLLRKQLGKDCSDDSDSEKSGKNIFASEKNKKNEITEDDNLLIALNEIGSKGGFKFDDFYQSIEKDSLPKFVMFFFNIKSIDNVNLNNFNDTKDDKKRLNNNEIKNIEAVIDFLKKKEKKFEVLIFNFKRPALQKPSAILFYRNFLNFFFIKTSQKEIFERCSTLLCLVRKFEYDEYMLELIDPEVMLAICHFIIYGKLDYDKNQGIFLPTLQKYFKKAQVPNLLNGRINMEYSYCRLPDSIFYLYQFMFDRLDSGPPSRHVAEIILNGMKKMQSIHVPKTEVILTSINAKIASIAFQREGVEIYQKRKNKNVNNNDNDDSSSYKENESKKISNIPVSIKERQKSYESKEKVLLQDQYQSIIDAYKVWNPETMYEFDNGILINKSKMIDKNMSQNDWTNEMKSLLKNNKTPKSNSKSDNDSQHLFYLQKKNKEKSKFYPLFSFDTDSNQWLLNQYECERLFEEQSIEVQNSQTPIVLFMNSFEKDSVKIISHLINGEFPELNESEDSICVYGFCEKTLPYINYNIDLNKKNGEDIRPLFLFLHVPESKRNNKNIKSIVTQFYSYISLFSDLNVIILNQNHYLDQIELLKQLSKINIYCKKQNKEMPCRDISSKRKESNESDFSDDEQNQFNNESKGDSNNRRLYERSDNDEENKFTLFDSDDDFDDDTNGDSSNNVLYNNKSSDNDEENKFTSFNSDDDFDDDNNGDSSNNVLYNNKSSDNIDDFNDRKEEEDEIDDSDDDYDVLYDYTNEENYKKDYVDFVEFSMKNTRMIVLLNDKTVNSDQNFDDIIHKSSFFDNIKTQISNEAQMYLINVDDPITYKSFLNNMNLIISKTNSPAQKMLRNFLCSKIINQISEKYIELRESPQYNVLLPQFLSKRYSSLEASCSNPLSILFTLQEEIKNYLPIYDKEILSECNNFILRKKEDYYEKNRKILNDELKTSSRLNLSELTEKVNANIYWTKNQIEAITHSHIQFLKEEFFDIIKMLFDDKIQYMSYSQNIGILNKQIEEDKKKILKIFKSFIEKIKIKESIKEQNIQEGSLKRTNYTLRETENIREIKVIVQISEDLKSEIEQDF